ncbi:MAG: formylglycine-generating enzyme family protein, partial [Acidobacteria bacterium]|nr:formylglycine-generating enzyme family protein [Acidobacteriota bacterium]
MSSFTFGYIIRDVNDGNLIVVGTGTRVDDSRMHGFVAKTTSSTFIEFIWPPAEIEGWTAQFSPDNPASSDPNWAPYGVPDNAFVFHGPYDPRIFVDRNISGYNYVATNPANPNFSALTEGEWANWVLDLSSIIPDLVLYYVVIVPADNSPVPVVSVTINRPAGVWMVGDPISFTARLRNTEDFVLGAPAALGCVKNADLTVTCTPTAVGTYDITAWAAADPSVFDTITVTVVERVAISISPSSVELAIGETQIFTVTKENADDFTLRDLPGMGCVKIDSETVECTPTFWVEGRTRDVVVMASQYTSKTASASITVEALPDLPENFSITRTNGGQTATFNMIYVEGGTYTRGRNAREDDEERGLPPPDQYETPAHQVTLSSFWIQDREVTGAMRRAAGDNTGTGTAPLSNINWFEANQVACYLSNATGRPFRLLSDAEWEFAARGGNVGKDDDFIFSGSNVASDVATYSGRGSLSAPPGTGASVRSANQLGIYDMSGNAYEWVYDWIESYTSTPKVDPVMSMGMGNKTRRGGSTDEPAINARVTRRAIRSREGGAGMGMRLGYGPLPPGMQTPCDAAASGYARTAPTGDEFRDNRLIVGYDEVWASSTSGTNTLIARSDGAGSVSNQRGSWFTVNDRVLYILTANGVLTPYPYFMFNMNEMTVITDPNGSVPTRYYRVPNYLLTSDPVEPVATGASLAEMIALVPPDKILTRDQLENPDTTVRDQRLILEPDEQGRERRWFFDGNCCGGNHKYRIELRANGTAEFVVMDYDNGGTGTAAGTAFTENVLATTRAAGYWFTTGDVALHLYDPTSRSWNNYLYTVGERTSGSTTSHNPPGPVHTHVSMQS